jgi:predicted MFS family arabinose efflux permease
LWIVRSKKGLFMDSYPARSDAAAHDQSEKLPVAALLALAMTGFLCIATETLPAGLLPQISEGLKVSPSMAGQLVTAYAVGSLVAAIPLTIATSNWPRRHVLLATILGFLVFNSVTAMSSQYWLTLAARFFAGVSAGLAWSIVGAYARRMVAPHLQGRAMALAMVGTPVALSLGVPLGTWMGGVLGWRAAFGVMSLLTVMLIGWVLIKVPNYAGQPATSRTPLNQVLATPGVLSVLGVVVAWMLAHNILYTYVAPFVAPAGLEGRVDLVLLVFGAAALIGIWVTGRIVDRALRTAVLASLVMFGLTALVFGTTAASPIVVYVGVGIWGLTFGGAATLLQTALADSAGRGADVALSLNVVAWNAAIAAGGILGGVLLRSWGVGSFPWAMLTLVLLALILTWSARTNGFPPGDRRQTTPAIGH